MSSVFSKFETCSNYCKQTRFVVTDGSDEEEPVDDQAAEGEGNNSMETALGLKGPRAETETERRIRLGEMTPFGTRLKDASLPASASSVPRPSLQGSDGLTDFERYLADQTQKSQKKGGSSKSGGTVVPSVKVEKGNEKSVSHTTERKSELKRKHHDDSKSTKSSALGKSSASKQKVRQDRGQGSRSMEEEADSDGSEYEPDDEDEEDSFSDENDDESSVKERKRLKTVTKGKRRMRDLSSSDGDSDGDDRRKKAIVKKRMKRTEGDDGVLANYQDRIRLALGSKFCRFSSKSNARLKVELKL